MSLYGPTFHVTPVDLCIILQCKLYISCVMSCGNKIVSNCFILFIFTVGGCTLKYINKFYLLLTQDKGEV